MKRIVLASLFIGQVFAENVFISKYVFKWGETHPEVVERYLKSSISNVTSSYILGNLYLTGTFLNKDLQKADTYITMAANKNLPEALNSIGDGYYSGDIREKNLELALYYYEKAAKLGFGAAQFNAGIVLLNNHKSKKDLKKAIFYLDLASKNERDLGEITKAARKYLKLAKSKYEANF